MNERVEEHLSSLLEAIHQTGGSIEDRVEVFNEVSAELGVLVGDFAPDPALSPRLVKTDRIIGNDYNPNHVASPELDLLEQSMKADGITMCIVVIADGPDHVVVDGFHRRTVGDVRLGREYLPCAIIDKPIADRMASTVRHNRARGKHQVELMADLVKTMASLGWEEEKIAEAMGMTGEELLRLRQITGAAKMLAAEEYTREWKVKR